MKLLTFLLLFAFVGCDLDELEEEPGSDGRKGFEYLEAEKNLDNQERELLQKFCETLKSKPTNREFYKKVVTIERYCDGRVDESQEKTVKYDRVQFREILSGGRSLNYVLPEILTITNNNDISEICGKSSELTISRYFFKNTLTAKQVRMSGDISRCYYNGRKKGLPLDGICMQVIAARASTPGSNEYDTVVNQENYIIFEKSVKAFPIIGIPKYRLFVHGTCTANSSAKVVTEEIYTGP